MTAKAAFGEIMFPIIPDPKHLYPLTPELAANAEREFSRLKSRFGEEKFVFFSSRPEFKSVLALSDFIADTLYAYPDECLKLLKTGALDFPLYALPGSVPSQKVRPSEDPDDPIAKDVVTFLKADLHENDLKKKLRILRRTRLAMLAWRDLTGMAPLDEVFRTLTSYAEQIVLRTLDLVRASFKISLGDALEDDGTPVKLLCYGMGKLGGGELNFSSDIDLIFCFPHEGGTKGGRSQVSFTEFFSRIVQRTANLLSDRTADSFCYRIDLRLRPFGDAGAMVSSFEALSNYYETQGRTWERYALVKARLLGGPAHTGEDGEELISMLKPFVFRRYLDYGAVESLRKLKRLIESEVRRRSLNGNFKLGKGGIREIEFVAQVFQLMRGGRIPELRARNLRTVLGRLSDLKLMPEEVSELLDECYCYLRRIENCLQELSDRQTQTLPATKRDQDRLLIALNRDPNEEGAWEKFVSELETVTSAVHGEFIKVVSSEEAQESADEKASEAFSDLISSDCTREDLLPLFEEKLQNPSEASKLCDEVILLQHTLSRMPVGPVGRETLQKLMPRLLAAVCGLENCAAVFKKLGKLVSTIALRTPYLQLLRDNAQVLKRVVSIISENAFATDLITAHPILLDELIMPQYFSAPPSPDEFLAALKERMLRIEEDDLEQQMEEMRLFKKLTVFRVSLSDKAGRLPLMKISDCLTFLAEACVRECLQLAWRYTVKQYGAPKNTDAADPGLAVIAYGKLGGIELGYKSDLDMVFIREENDGDTEGEKSVPCLTFYQRLTQKLLHFSTTRTQGGVLYDMDMRLRPDGDSGLLITDVKGYEDYQLRRAWTWEHQALVRARPIAGSKKVCERFEKIRDEVLRQKRDPEKLRSDVLSMRKKMMDNLDRGNDKLFDLKQSCGGIVDIEFLAQYLLLREAPLHKDMVLWTDNVRILEECARLSIISHEDCDALCRAYIVLRGWYHKLSLADLKRILPRSETPKECLDVVKIWNRIFRL